MVAVFIEQPTPFIEEFFRKLFALEYPKESIDMYLHIGVAYHEEDVAHFVEDSPSSQGNYVFGQKRLIKGSFTLWKTAKFNACAA